MSTSARQVLIGELLSWPGVTEQPHRFGGIEFQWNGKEIGHLHGDHLVDIPFPRRMGDQLAEAGRASPHHIHPGSGWVSFYIESEEDIAGAVELLRLKYDHMVNRGESGKTD
ncbi:hypothetical protein GE107_25995 [Cohnella sp. CFH 77786]|uniref:luciferase domain-containing protein n=1 Tax=Cohnella sp. CFH 77786 TaxID=2662265 RepID=UPI001C60D822|nr:luciferase family protein [Cohnella sp. CFH 77786]MBW5449268.1 hypothetical protein [Cohnella sp. CFH 77786]MBW5449465.1 hypothetical protein [Cohnella sp. CFH 77786]